MSRTPLAGLGAFFLMLALALAALLYVGTDADRYARIQAEEGVEAGISEDEMAAYDGMLADYLKGDASALSGATLFHEREIAHMADVYRLFALARRVLAASCALGVALVFFSCLRNRSWRRAFARGAGVACALFYLPILALVIWAFIDFNSAFTAMHRALFSNKLWLLNPETDLMIRMLPERFFVHMASDIAPAALLAPLFPLVLLLAAAGLGNAASRAKVRGGLAKEEEDGHEHIRLPRKRER